MGATGRVSIGSSQDTVLASFDEMLQAALPSAVDSTFGKNGIRYSMLFTIFACSYMPQAADNFAAVFHGKPIREVLLDALYNVVMVLCGPLYLAILSLGCSRCLKLVGVADKLYVFVIWSLTSTTCFAYFGIVQLILWGAAARSESGLLVYCIYILFSLICTALLFRDE